MTNEELQARLDDIDAQLRHLFQLHGPAKWENIKRQRAENESNIFIDKKGHLTFKPGFKTTK
jgi:hypothetical protein